MVGVGLSLWSVTTSPTVVGLLVVVFWLPGALGLDCNVCVNADIKADCHLNQEQCSAEYVCFVETSVIKYKNSRGHEAILHIYR